MGSHNCHPRAEACAEAFAMHPLRATPSVARRGVVIWTIERADFRPRAQAGVSTQPLRATVIRTPGPDEWLAHALVGRILERVGPGTRVEQAPQAAAGCARRIRAV